MGIKRRVIAAVATATIGVLGVGTTAAAELNHDDFWWQCWTGRGQTSCRGLSQVDQEPIDCFYDPLNNWYVEVVPYIQTVWYLTFKGNVKVNDNGDLIGANRKTTFEFVSGPDTLHFARVVPSCP